MDQPIPTTPLHLSAKMKVISLVMRYCEQLILQSKIVASSTDAPVVMSNHVEDARLLVAKRTGTNKGRDTVLIFGSALLGAFVSGFIEGIVTSDLNRVVIWTVFGIIGVCLTMFGLWGMN
jgi:hypothetical protein